MERDPHSGPVPDQAWHADTLARLDMIDQHAAEDGTIALRVVVDAAQERYADHPPFPRSSPQRIRRRNPD